MNRTQTFTRQQLRELEAELLGERARLERSMGDHEAGGAWPVAGDAGAGESPAIGGLSVQTLADARYDAICAAIARLAEGTYGICVTCQQPIPYGRLIVMPEVISCLGCRSG